jgi:hypothetical protein
MNEQALADWRLWRQKQNKNSVVLKQQKMSVIRSWELWDMTGLYKDELKVGHLKE